VADEPSVEILVATVIPVTAVDVVAVDEPEFVLLGFPEPLPLT
jgi:hypothetical protein